VARARASRVHEGLVGPRALIGTSYLADPELRRQYAVEIAPRTRAALGKVLAEVFPQKAETDTDTDAAPDTRPRPRVLDLGAGTGAAGDAIRAHFGTAATVVAVDRIASPGVITADLAAPGALRGVDGRFDVIVAAHLLNELFNDAPAGQRTAARSRKVLGWCDSFLADGGTVIIIEPALRETSRDLLGVRDLLLTAGLHVVAPCLWAGPCPALARERDWCHDAATRSPGDPRAAGRVDFSYLVLRRTGRPATDPALFRIVSDALVEKGRLRLFGCGPAGRHPLVRLDRHRTPANEPFDQLVRGDVARVRGTAQAGDGLRILEKTVVEPVV
jgi:SAM-dependent methyltransferase